MAKLNLLSVVQDIQSSLDYEEANDINETEEAMQIAKVIRNVFGEFKTLGDWGYTKKVRQLAAVSDTNRPTLLQFPSGVSEIKNFKYDKTRLGITAKDYADVTFLETEDFLDHIYGRSTDNDNVIEFNTDEGIPIIIINDVPPQRWTTFDETTIICDSYDAEVDTTLVQAKTIVEVIEDEPFVFQNTFLFGDMPDKVFPTFLSRCRVVAHEYLADEIPQSDVQTANRGLSRLRLKESKVNEPRRKRRTYGRR
jgi:hypothetical protein